ncbi:hypothetical protein ACH46N_19750 [Streptomyces pristinaespiralis]|jgi:hypothetical protein|uniref:Predicted protein n=2 Tax=Streptomyces pristinaespiralis TaxID=38300 RepID=D6X8I6_STRE2|nr:hypothetical protein [Streptomyces pristinaespiralis]ALC21645.1 hypothetical protein SPRI_3339 [Streptomyces pristinaespiralis]EFH31210.1 predicted protein [Streptomyces pristinaespiralis ATCC 25486]QMU15654.1 hypothetical protein H3L99_20305 [Streptomyces pristinaespiralis]
MREIAAIIGWVTGVQGVPGRPGPTFGDKPWGLLHKWWDLPSAGYIAVAVAGVALALTAETAKKRA